MLWLIQRRLKSKKTAARRKAVERLCGAPHPRALRTLRAALGDEDAEVRRLAATALGKLEDAACIEPLLAALRDGDAEVQKAAILSLKRASDERVTAALVPMLHHGNAGVRGCAARVLEFSGWHPATREDEMWFLIAKGKFSQVAAFGTVALAPLEMVLNSGPYSLSVAAVHALAEIDDQRVVRTLLKALNSNDAAVCASAVDALARVGGPEAREPVIAMLRHKNGHVRLSAVEALGTLGAGAVLEPLLALLNDPLWDVRRAAVEALGRLKDEEAVESLTRMLADPDSDVREATAMALGALGDRRAVRPLVLALKDSTSSVRHIAAAALARIDENWSLSPEAHTAAEDLKPALYDQDPNVRHIVGQLLVGLGTVEREAAPDAAPTEKPGSTQERRRKLAIRLFQEMLCDLDRDLRQAAAEALGRLGARQAELALVRALRDPDAGVRGAAEQALQLLVADRSAS